MGITPGIPRPTGSGLGDIPASRMVGNFGPTHGPAVAVDRQQVLAWLEVVESTTFTAFVGLVSADIAMINSALAQRVLTTDSRLSDARTPLAHNHGSISNAGTIGNTANLPLITGAGGVIQVGSFGTTANTFCQGNDARLTNSREWVAETVSIQEAVEGIATIRRAWTAELVHAAAVSAFEFSSYSNRTGVIFDNAIDDRALSCSDTEWTFGSESHRDNLRIALNAVETFNTNITGNQNLFNVNPPADNGGFASLNFASHSGPEGDNFGITDFACSAEEGFHVNTANGQVAFSAGEFYFFVTPSSYIISHPENFRQAISAVETFDTYITGGQNKFEVTPPFEDGGRSSLFFQSHSGSEGDNFGWARLEVDAEYGARLAAITNTVDAPFYQLRVHRNGYEVSQEPAFRKAINAPSQDEALYYAIALGGI